MEAETKLSARDVPKHLREGYKGRQLYLRAVESVDIPIDSGLWSGGSRETYKAVRLEDGAGIRASDDFSSPWNPSRTARTVQLRDGFAIVKRTYFCGKDCGLTFYVHPSNVAKLLKA